MQFGQESSVSPFPNLVLLSACPWQHWDTPLSPLVAHQGRGHAGFCPVAEEMKHSHLPCSCTRTQRAKTNSDTACRTLLQHLRRRSSPGLLPWDPKLQRWLSSSLSPPFSFCCQRCQLSIQALQNQVTLNPEI